MNLSEEKSGISLNAGSVTHILCTVSVLSAVTDLGLFIFSVIVDTSESV